MGNFLLYLKFLQIYSLTCLFGTRKQATFTYYVKGDDVFT